MFIKMIGVRLLLSLLVLVSLTSAVAAREATAPAAPAGQQAGQWATILPVDQVRPGMKGYGMTVFQGVAIEPFAVEVVSVMHSDYFSGPKRSVIWIRCPDARMKESGPVAGMSGSPIYLWADDEPQGLGKGGRLIGAFAYGFMASKECYVGVQPIELMREVGSRADASKIKNGGNGRLSPQAAGAQLRVLAEQARKTSHAQAWRIDSIGKLLDNAFTHDERAQETATDVPVPQQWQGTPTRMYLPLTVRSTSTAEALRPLLTPLGMSAMAAADIPAGTPPAWIDPVAIKLEPGSVFSIPLAFGDLDVAAIGTVTDVAPDGTVLAFGHAMSGMGEITMPMASGFVHFILPGTMGSFKVGGTARILGGMVRDENSAVAGRPGVPFRTAPVVTHIHLPAQPQREYKMQVAYDRSYTPIIAAVVAGESLVAAQAVPMDSTLHLTGTITLEGGRTINLDSLLPNGSNMEVMFAVAPPLIMMANNPFQPVMLESLDLKMDVTRQVLLGTIVQGRIDRAEARPGEDITVTVGIQQPAKPRYDKHVTLTLPESLPDGAYEVTVCDAQAYMGRVMANRPYLGQIDDVDELFEMVKMVMELRSDALYVVTNLPQPGLAVDRRELPRLPSSRQALIASPTHTLATPYREWIEKIVPMDVAISGELTFVVNVSKSLVDR